MNLKNQLQQTDISALDHSHQERIRFNCAGLIPEQTWQTITILLGSMRVSKDLFHLWEKAVQIARVDRTKLPEFLFSQNYIDNCLVDISSGIRLELVPERLSIIANIQEVLQQDYTLHPATASLLTAGRDFLAGDDTMITRMFLCLSAMQSLDPQHRNYMDEASVVKLKFLMEFLNPVSVEKYMYTEQGLPILAWTRMTYPLLWEQLLAAHPLTVAEKHDLFLQYRDHKDAIEIFAALNIIFADDVKVTSTGLEISELSLASEPITLPTDLIV